MYPQQRRQFIPHGAIKSVGIVVVFFWCGFVMTYVQFLFSQWLDGDLPGSRAGPLVLLASTPAY
jgi:hypothetical protein